MIRPNWTAIDIAGELHTNYEAWALEAMVDEVGDPKPRFATWTPKQALAHCRNIAAERERAYAHETGAVK